MHYVVTPQDGGALLSVEANFPPGLPRTFQVDDSMTGWLESPEIETASGWTKLPFDGGALALPGCEHGCRVRYRFDLAAAAREARDVAYAASIGGAFLAPPSTWLLRPAGELSGVPYRFEISPPGAPFLTGVLRASPLDDARAKGASTPANGAAPAVFGADVSDLPDSPYSLFGQFTAASVPVDNGSLQVAIVNNPPPASNAVIVKWIADSASAVAALYGRFPLPGAAVIVLVEDGADIGYATTLGNGGASIVARAGRDAPEATLRRSSQMTHEMLHLAFPNLPRAQAWMEEGMATYFERIARARAGALPELDVWRGLLRGLFFAQPLPGEGGLDDTPTWGRTYWGGALFCLLADVRIREQTGNSRGLEHALRAVLDAGGDVSRRWTLDRVLATGDAATGTTVLRDLHAEMGPSPMTVDLADLWSRLGVQSAPDGSLVLDDGAPLAPIRRAIVGAKRPPTAPLAN